MLPSLKDRRQPGNHPIGELPTQKRAPIRTHRHRPPSLHDQIFKREIFKPQPMRR